MDALNTRVLQITPEIGRAGAEDLPNFASFNDCLGMLTQLVERPLDEPPADAASSSPSRVVSEPHDTLDPTLLRHCLKIGFAR